MVLPVYIYGHPVLRKKADEIDLNQSNLQQLIEDLYETMYNDNGVGLAAPQIGRSLRIFVIDTASFSSNDNNNEIFKGVFINPVLIEEFGDDFTFCEGCLSIPELNADITRKSKIKVEYFDENLKKQKKVFEGIVARVFQHEYDHLEGKIFIDKLPPVKKMMLKRRLHEIATGKTKPNYKTIIAK